MTAFASSLTHRIAQWQFLRASNSPNGESHLKIKSLVGTALAMLALTWAMAIPATAAVQLPVDTAADKAFTFAKRTCAHDRNCVRYGVTNCRRQSMHVVLCRIFDERSTEAQGKYHCTRLVRVALDPVTYRIVVTGQAPWQC
jgi:hypothetical protein